MEDDVVMYLVVNQDLNMGTGKTAAQVGHAVKAVVDQFASYYQAYIDGNLLFGVDYFDNEQCILYTKWDDGLEKMVCLRANTNQFNKIKEIYKDQCEVAVDAGLTEVEPGSETVICLFPMRKSSRDKILKRLQIL